MYKSGRTKSGINTLDSVNTGIPFAQMTSGFRIFPDFKSLINLHMKIEKFPWVNNELLVPSPTPLDQDNL